MTQSTAPVEIPTDPKVHLNKKLESMAWGIFLIMTGCLWLSPNRPFPEGAGLIGISDLFGLDLPFFPILIILWGMSHILEPFLKKKLK